MHSVCKYITFGHRRYLPGKVRQVSLTEFCTKESSWLSSKMFRQKGALMEAKSCDVRSLIPLLKMNISEKEDHQGIKYNLDNKL